MLIITGNYTQTANGQLNLRLQAAGQYDRLDIHGTATLDGTIFVSALPGFNPQAGDEFTLLTYGAVNGNISFYVLPALFPPRGWAPAGPGATTLVLRVQ